MIVYTSRFLTRAEVWFDEPTEDTSAVDWVLHNQCPEPVAGARCKYFYTYAIDLTRARQELQENLNGDTAYKIRRARDRDKFTCLSCDPRDPSIFGRFEEMYNRFAALKGLLPLDRARTASLVATGGLDLSVAQDSRGEALVYHANYRNSRRATGMYSPSLFRGISDSATRNLVGRANRLLTWCDLVRYQEQGLRCFDFGGWYPGTSDQTLLKINEFKRGFGGQVLREFECERILSLRGWLVLRVAQVLKRSRLFPRRHEEPVEDAPPGVRDAVAGPAA